MARTCPNCDAETLPDAVHCHRCGAKLDAPAAASQDASSSDAGPATGDWRTAAEDAGVGESDIPAPRDPHGPHADGAPLGKDSTNWAMGAHLSALVAALASVGALVFIGPLIVWLMKRDQDPFVERHAREALNFNLLMLALVIVGLVVSVLTLGFGLIVVVPVGLVIGLVWLVTTIIGTVKAANGEEYSYPFNIPLVK